MYAQELHQTCSSVESCWKPRLFGAQCTDTPSEYADWFMRSLRSTVLNYGVQAFKLSVTGQRRFPFFSNCSVAISSYLQCFVINRAVWLVQGIVHGFPLGAAVDVE